VEPFFKSDHENQRKNSCVSVFFSFACFLRLQCQSYVHTETGTKKHFYRASPAEWNKVSAVILNEGRDQFRILSSPGIVSQFDEGLV